MSEIKTINGKVKFICVPTDTTEEWKISGTNYLCVKEDGDWQAIPPRLDDGSKILCRLSEITEDQTNLLVDYAECRINGVRVFYDYGNKTTSLPTAKESLFSLLKANGCWIKEWKERPVGKFIDTKSDIVDWDIGRARIDYKNTPDDYLLIIKL